jgi:RHS repeat-associated protein
MLMPGRKYKAGSGLYRYGFNGKENDNEVKGDGNQIPYDARIYDPRLGRWLSVDPLQKKYADLTPYNFCLNNPILFTDPDGKDVIIKDQSGNKVAVFKNDGTIVITKGMENSSALHSYQDARTYLGKSSNSLTILEKSTKSITIRVTNENITGGGTFTPSQHSISGTDINKNGKLELNEASNATFASNDIGTINWNPGMALSDGERNLHSPALVLDHEAKHGKHALSNLLQYLKNRATPTTDGTDNVEEQTTINETNLTSINLKNGDGGYGKRLTHRGYNMYPSNGVTTTDKKVEPTDFMKMLKDAIKLSAKGSQDNLGGTSDPEVRKREQIKQPALNKTSGN